MNQDMRAKQVIIIIRVSPFLVKMRLPMVRQSHWLLFVHGILLVVSFVAKTVIEMYFEQYTLPGSHEFNALAWWKLNGIKHLTLSIPLLRSLFSTSGRIVGPQCSELLLETIEAIICTQIVYS